VKQKIALICLLVASIGTVVSGFFLLIGAGWDFLDRVPLSICGIMLVWVIIFGTCCGIVFSIASISEFRRKPDDEPF